MLQKVNPLLPHVIEPSRYSAFTHDLSLKRVLAGLDDCVLASNIHISRSHLSVASIQEVFHSRKQTNLCFLFCFWKLEFLKTFSSLIHIEQNGNVHYLVMRKSFQIQILFLKNSVLPCFWLVAPSQAEQSLVVTSVHVKGTMKYRDLKDAEKLFEQVQMGLWDRFQAVFEAFSMSWNANKQELCPCNCKCEQMEKATNIFQPAV